MVHQLNPKVIEFIQRSPQTIIIAGAQELSQDGHDMTDLEKHQAEYVALVKTNMQVAGDTPALFFGMFRETIEGLDKLGRKFYTLCLMSTAYSFMDEAEVEQTFSELGVNEEFAYWVEVLNSLV